MPDFIPPRVGRHEFETTVPARRSREVEESCEDFRSGQEYYFEGVVAPTTDGEPLEITVTITAKNLRGEHATPLRLPKNLEIIDAGELVDLATLKLKREFPIEKEVDRLFDAQQYDEIEIDEANND